MKRLTWFLASGVVACLLIQVLAWLVAPALPILLTLLLLLIVFITVIGGIPRL